MKRFYELRRGDADHPATQSELECAKKWIEAYGFDVVTQVMPKAVERLREKWPDGRQIQALDSFLSAVIGERNRLEQQRAKQRDHVQRELDRQQRQTEEARELEATFGPNWDAMSEFDQHAVFDRVAAGSPHFTFLDVAKPWGRAMMLKELASSTQEAEPGCEQHARSPPTSR